MKREDQHRAYKNFWDRHHRRPQREPDEFWALDLLGGVALFLIALGMFLLSVIFK